MGANDSADTRRGVAEAMRYAGVNGIALPSHQVIRLTVNGQHDFTLQYGAYLLTLMLDPLPGCGSRLVRFKKEFRERQPVDFQQLLQRTDGRTDFVLFYGADGTMC